MSLPLPFDRLMLLLDDPARLAALLAGPDLAPSPNVSARAVHAEDPLPDPAAAPGPSAAAMPASAVPTTEAPDAVLPVSDVRSAVSDAVPPPAANPSALNALMPEDAFPTIAELDAMLAQSYAPVPGPDAALRAEWAAALGLGPALVDNEDAFMAAPDALEPPPTEDLVATVSGEPLWVPAWGEAAREDWALG
jgi:hypothetical protein